MIFCSSSSLKSETLRHLISQLISLSPSSNPSFLYIDQSLDQIFFLVLLLARWFNVTIAGQLSLTVADPSITESMSPMMLVYT
jgi:hypothetical protein